MTVVNRVVLVGNLTRDPELRSTGSGKSVCRLRLACNTPWRDSETGEWVQKPNYFDVTVFGASGEACGRFLTQGRLIAVDGRLDWHEWETPGGERRQNVGVVAESVQFMPGGRTAGESADAADGGEQAEEKEEAIPF